MDTVEYSKLASVERDHWYYVGKREVVRTWMERMRPIGTEDLLLDCGAGSGIFAVEMSERCRVMVLDTHEESLAMLRARFSEEQVLTLENDEIPLPAGSVEYVTALDVLEHTPDDRAVVQGFARVVKPGGLAVVTVPASQLLWSDWDKVLHHYRRYSRGSLGELFEADQWRIEYVNYTNVPVFPLIWWLRYWRGLRGMGKGNNRVEDAVPVGWLNRLLKFQFVQLALSSLPMPFGVSLILIARRRG